jgi:hypothetical protein
VAEGAASLNVRTNLLHGLSRHSNDLIAHEVAILDHELQILPHRIDLFPLRFYFVFEFSDAVLQFMEASRLILKLCPWRSLKAISCSNGADG